MEHANQELRPLHILIPVGLHADLKALAERNDRSVAAETRRAIEDRLKHSGVVPAGASGEAA